MNSSAQNIDTPHPPVDASGAPTRSSGTLGRRTFIAGAVGAIAGATALSRSVSAVEPGASFFESLSPSRLCDTRNRPGQPFGYGYQRISDTMIRVRVAGNGTVPADGVAAVLTVTGVSFGTDNWLSVFPAGEPFPGTSNVNFSPYDSAVANLVTVKLGAGGAVDILSYKGSEVIVDVAGVYRPTSVAVAAGRFQALPAAVRPLDTRVGGAKPGAGAVVDVNLNGIVPANAIAVIANVTAVEATAAGFVTAFPLGVGLPATSNLNLAAGETRAVGVITKLGTRNGVIGFSLFTEQGAHLLADIAGYITGPGSTVSADGLFVPITPTRLLDTRLDKQRLWNGWTRSFTVPAPISSRAQAIVMNLTATRTGGAGYFTLYAAQTARTGVSNLNVNGADQTIANHAIVRLSSQGVSCFAYDSAHVICDVTGWYTGSPAAAVVAAPVNPAPPVAALPYSVEVPRMGLANSVLDGDPTSIVDRGQSWHWTGTGLAGQGTGIVLFGHRTSAGGPYYYQHLLQGGDQLYLRTADGRLYTYQLVSEFITGKYPNDILGAALQTPAETVSLVACTKTNRLPTSIQNRLVSTFALLDWVDLG
jgi:Sortase domain